MLLNVAYQHVSHSIHSHSSSSSSSKKRSGLSVDQNEYGKYGIIKEEHFYHKQRYNNTYDYSRNVCAQFCKNDNFNNDKDFKLFVAEKKD